MPVSVLIFASTSSEVWGFVLTRSEIRLALAHTQLQLAFSGQRSGSIVFDMKDTSQIPAVAEPWFLAFNAEVSLRPIMNSQDLTKAGPSIGKAAKQYGK